MKKLSITFVCFALLVCPVEAKYLPKPEYPKDYFDQALKLMDGFIVIPGKLNEDHHQAFQDTSWMHISFSQANDKSTNRHYNDYKKHPEQIKKYKLLKKLFRDNHPLKMNHTSDYKIPPIIHQVWFGGTPPKEFEILQASIFEHHPGWLYKLWTDEDLNKIKIYNQYYLKASTLRKAEMSDIFRQEILYIFGGFYLDWDIRCVRSLEPLARMYDFCVGMPGMGEIIFVNNAVIGCAPKHPILKHAIETIRNDRHIKQPELRTGPYHLTKSFVAIAQQSTEGIIALPRQFFYATLPRLKMLLPTGNSEVQHAITPQTFTIHYWAGTWIRKK